MLVILGGGLGAGARYLLSLALANPRFPYATVGVNLAGSLLLGVLLGAAARRDVHPVLVATLGPGCSAGSRPSPRSAWRPSACSAVAGRSPRSPTC